MDGVIADFVGGSLRVIGKTIPFSDIRWDYYGQIGMTEKEFWTEINKHGPEFWSGLESFDWTKDLVSLVSEKPWSILSTPSDHPQCQSGKIQWLQDKFGADFRNYVFTKNKQLLAKPGTVLIDDNDGNCARFKAAGGEAILFPQPWNENRGLIDVDPVDYVFKRLGEIASGTKVALRANSGKPQLGELLCFGHGLSAVSRVLEQGGKKYAHRNWMKGGKPDGEYIDSALRHLMAIQGGELHDQETGCLHESHVAWNMLAMTRLNRTKEQAEVQPNLIDGTLKT